MCVSHSVMSNSLWLRVAHQAPLCMEFSRQEYFYYNAKEKATTLWFLSLPIWWLGFHILSFNNFFVILVAIMLTSLEKILIRDQFCRNHLGTIPILSACFHDLWLIPEGGHHQQTKLFTWNQILNLWILILSKAIENISGFSKNDVTTLTLYFYMFLNRKTFQQYLRILQSIMQGQKRWDIPTLYVTEAGWWTNRISSILFRGPRGKLNYLYCIWQDHSFCIETFIFPINSLST